LTDERGNTALPTLPMAARGAVRIDDGNRAAVTAFDQRSAGDFDEDGVGHATNRP
jgi:hypothetical protein